MRSVSDEGRAPPHISAAQSAPAGGGQQKLERPGIDLLSAEGRELRAMHNRLTWALKQENGAWKIVHEHISAPVDFKTSKVILRR